MSAPLPAFRAGLEAIQSEHEGTPVVILRDVEGLREEAAVLTLPGFLIATLLDGRRTEADLRTEVTRMTGQVLTEPEIRRLLSELEQADLLETPALGAKRAAVLDAFRRSDVRKPAHMGGVYPPSVMDLAAMLGAYFRDPKGPGREFASSPLGLAPAGVVAPHIDFFRGGPAYAWAYQALSESRPPDVVLALGVAHMSPPSPWVFTNKAYETPYGSVAVDSALYDALAACLWYDPKADEPVHRLEHSLEFQALWLKYLWREKTPPWVPVLCSSFDAFCDDRPPSAIPAIEDAIRKMEAAVAAAARAGRRITVLAGVDLAHVGPRFGDEVELNDELLKKIEAADRVSMEKALALDADGFYMATIEGGHWRKVCGLSALYTGLRLMKAAGASAGKLLAYGQAPDPMGGVVSFPGAIFPAGSTEEPRLLSV